MASLGKIFLYLTVVVVVGALAAPMAWEVIQHLPAGWFGGGLGKIQGMPFHRYLSRSLQVAALLLLPWLLRSLRIRSLSELSLRPNPCPLRDFWAGVAAGVLGISLLVFFLMITGAYRAEPGWPGTILSSLPKILISAVVVALLEEFLFRGVLLGLLRQVLTPSAAVVLSAIPFALLHFVNLPREGSVGSVTWETGLGSLWQGLCSLPPPTDLLWGCATLLLAGLLLGWLTVRTGALHAAIGMHALWIIGQQALNRAAHYQVSPPEAFLPLLGPAQCSGMVPIGALPLAALGVAWGVAAMMLRKRRYPVLS